MAGCKRTDRYMVLRRFQHTIMMTLFMLVSLRHNQVRRSAEKSGQGSYDAPAGTPSILGVPKDQIDRFPVGGGGWARCIEGAGMLAPAQRTGGDAGNAVSRL